MRFSDQGDGGGPDAVDAIDMSDVAVFEQDAHQKTWPLRQRIAMHLYRMVTQPETVGALSEEDAAGIAEGRPIYRRLQDRSVPSNRIVDTFLRGIVAYVSDRDIGKSVQLQPDDIVEVFNFVSEKNANGETKTELQMFAEDLGLPENAVASLLDTCASEAISSCLFEDDVVMRVTDTTFSVRRDNGCLIVMNLTSPSADEFLLRSIKDPDSSEAVPDNVYPFRRR